MSPSPSRSHCTAAPAMKIDASSAYAGAPAASQASVARSPSPALGRRGAGVHEEEGAGAVGVLPLPGVPASLAEERGLLVAGDAADRDLPGESEELAARRAEIAGGGADLGEERARDAEELAQLAAPRARADVEEHRARRVAVVGGVHAAAGEAPDEPAVHGAEGELAARGALGERRLREEPLELRRREVGIDDEPRARGDLGGARRELGAALRGAPVLPDDRARDGLAGGAVPEDDRLALVGDADRGGGDARLRDRLARRFEGAVEDVHRVVLDPSRLREVLRDLAVAAAGDAAGGVEHERGRAGGAFVDREDVAGRHGRNVPRSRARRNVAAAVRFPGRRAPHSLLARAPAMAYSVLAFDVRDRVATVTVNRPEKLNALNDATIAELGHAIGEMRRARRHRRRDRDRRRARRPSSPARTSPSSRRRGPSTGARARSPARRCSRASSGRRSR